MAQSSDEFADLPRVLEFTLGDLQGEIPVFPLAGALLLPRGRLPLNIFEPRYLAMINDALRGRRLIGMLQPQGVEADEEEQAETPPDDDEDNDDEDDAERLAALRRKRFPPAGRAGNAGATPWLVRRPTTPPVYRIGCVGRLISFLEREDGTYSIALAGIARFQVRRELDLIRGYRRVDADFSSFAGDLAAPESFELDREGLIEALRRYFVQRGFEARWDAIDQMDDETLIITLSMICPFAAAEKQALLEAETAAQRAHILHALLQMAGHETGEGGRKPHAV